MANRRQFLGLVGGAVGAGSVAVSQAQQSSDQSDTFRRTWGDPGGNTYVSGSGTPRQDIELSWQRSFDARPVPIVEQGGNLFLLFDSGKVLSLNTEGQTYEMSLINRMPGAITGALVQGTRLMVIDEENTMAAFDFLDRTRLWQRTHTDPIGEPVYANGALYYPTATPSLLRFDPEGGSELAELDVPSRIRETNLNDPIQLVTDAHERDIAPYVYGSIPGNSGGIFAYNTDSQSLEWAKSIEDHHLRSIVSNGSLVTTADSAIYRLDPRTGQIEWQQTRDINLGQVAVDTSDAIVIWTGEEILAVDPTDGTSLWESGLNSPYSRAVICSNDTVYVINNSDPAEVIALELTTGLERWRYPFCDSGRLQRPALTDEFLLVGHEQTLYAFSNESGPMRQVTTESTSADPATDTPGTTTA